MKKSGFTGKDDFIVLFIFLILVPVFFIVSHITSGLPEISLANDFSTCLNLPSGGRYRLLSVALCIVFSWWSYYYRHFAYGISTGVFSWQGLVGLIIVIGSIWYVVYRFKKSSKGGLIAELRAENHSIIGSLVTGFMIFILPILIVLALIYFLILT